MDRSVLELVVGGTPFPHGGPDGEWRYRHAVRSDGATALDRQAVADFHEYETRHGRQVMVVAAPELSDWDWWQAPVERPAPGSFSTQCCSDVYADGCTADLVCHGTPASTAIRILSEGRLRPASVVRDLSSASLAAASSWGEPPDYFDHVMFANGRCTAPEAVATSRALGRDLVPSDLGVGYPPSVRFYFRWADLVQRPEARFDGVHPVKIEGELALIGALVAVVAPTGQGLDDIRSDVDHRLRDRIVILDVDSPRPEEWSTAALAAARARC